MGHERRGHILTASDGAFACGWQPPEGWTIGRASEPCPYCLEAVRWRTDHPATRTGTDLPRNIGWASQHL